MLCLGSLVAGVFGESTVVYEEMGDGGIERWVAYPVVIWTIAFGAYLAATGSADPAAYDNRSTR